MIDNNNNDKDIMMSEKDKNEMIKREIEKYRNNEQIGSSNFSKIFFNFLFYYF